MYFYIFPSLLYCYITSKPSEVIPQKYFSECFCFSCSKVDVTHYESVP